MSTWRKFYKLQKDQIEWIDASLSAVFVKSEKVKERDDYQVSEEIFNTLQATKAGIARIDADRKSLAARVAKKASRMDPNEIQGCEEALKGRKSQIVQLKSIAQALRGQLRSAIGGVSTNEMDEERGSADEVEEDVAMEDYDEAEEDVSGESSWGGDSEDADDDEDYTEG